MAKTKARASKGNGRSAATSRDAADRILHVTLGLRTLTSRRKSLEFLDYLLALVQHEAEDMSTTSQYH
ncbi:MAG TPA: hypothetical protein VG894_12515 [Bauldia sp.]|nr:hypothetical protein [Bauldia sp.]